MRSDRLPKVIQNCDLQLPLRSGGQFRTVIDTIQQALQRNGIDPVSWKALALDKAVWAATIRRDLYKHSRIRPRRRVVLPSWATSPHLLLGHYIEKRFQNKWHVGKIVNFDTSEDTNEILWRVEYDDGDEEDLQASGLLTTLCVGMRELYCN